VKNAKIPFSFKKGTEDVVIRHHDLTEIVFEDGTRRLCKLLFAADGGKSVVRSKMAGTAVGLKYTGVTCLMGISESSKQMDGKSLPSSIKSQMHAVYFPTGPNEQCFQIHVPIDTEHAESKYWGNLSNAACTVECEDMAEKLVNDGWAEKYVEPLLSATHAVKVGFALLEPRLTRWVYGKNSRIVLLGDAAHPPVPYVCSNVHISCSSYCFFFHYACFLTQVFSYLSGGTRSATRHKGKIALSI